MPAAATLRMRGLAQRDCRASCNRSLRCSLQENGHISGIRRHCVEGDMEDRFSPVPRPEGAELADDIELCECPSGVLATPHSGLRLLEVSGHIDLIPGKILAVWDAHCELATRDLEFDRNGIYRFEHRGENATLIRPYKATAA